MNNIIKLVLVVFLLVCLAYMLYGYYQFVRFAAMCKSSVKSGMKV